MKTLSLSILASIAIAASLRAQQPIPPPDTIFPLGGLTTGGLFGGLNSNSSIVKLQIPNFGLNMEFNGPLPLGSGQSSVVGPGGVGDALNQFFPGGTNASGSSPGWNPLFTEWDFDLVSNESTDNGAAWNPAWDLVYRGWNPNLGIPTSTIAGAEWKIVSGATPAGTDYLDAGSNNNSLTVPIGSPSDFLGGAGVLYLDFVSRLDLSGSNYSGNSLTDPVYEVNASANAIEQQSTDGGVTWTTSTTNLAGTTLPTGNILPANPACGDASCPTCICITLGDYGNATDHSQPGYYNRDYTSTHFGNDYATELANITTFPNSNDPLHPQSQTYSVFRLKFDIAGAGFDLNQTESNGTMIRTIVSSINFSLIGTANSQGIFVRGVRARTDWADDLYRNKFLTSSTAPDGHTLNLYDDKNPKNVITITQGLEGQEGVSVGLFQHLRSDMGSNWKYASLLDLGNECNWPAWRTFAYLNEALRKWSAAPANGGQPKNLTTIIAGTGGVTNMPGGSLVAWRSIYEDQSYTSQNGVAPPPPLQDEAIAFGLGFCCPQNGGTTSLNYGFRDHDFTSGNILFAGDDIPSAVKNHISPLFNELGRAITGWQNPGYGGTPITSGSEPNDDYATYTVNMQAELSNLSSINQTCAETSYPQSLFPETSNSNAWTSFYGYASAWEGVRGNYPAPPNTQWAVPTYSPHSFDGETLQQNLLSSIESSPPSIKTSAFCWLLPYSSLDDATAITTLDHQFEPGLQPSTSWEIREQTWDCLTWGAKGIIYNPMGTDGLINMGFCGNNFESTPNSGFPELINGDQITQPPGNITLPWTSGASYVVGQWVIDNGSNNCSDNTPWVCVSDVSGTVDPCSDALHWAKSNTYCYYGNVNLTPANGYIIPPQTSASPITPSYFPDHMIISNPYLNACYLWIPCISDFTITKNGNPDIMVNTPLTSNLVNDYLNAIQGQPGFTISPTPSTNQVNYYSQFLPPPGGCPSNGFNGNNRRCVSLWMPAALGSSGYQDADEWGSLASDPNQDDWTKGNWIAGDRDLDKDFLTYFGNNTPERGPCRNCNQTPLYDWYDIPLSFPTASLHIALTGVPTYYGVKDRADGVRRSMSDIAPIAWELKNLQWVTSYNYADYQSALSAISNNGPLTANQSFASGKIQNANQREYDNNFDGPHSTGDPVFPFEVKSEHVYDPARAQTSNPDPNTYHFNGYAPLWQASNTYSKGNWVVDAQGFYWICRNNNVLSARPPISDPTDWGKNGTGEFKFQTNGETDDNSTTTDSLFYNIGVFHDPNDLDAIYTTIANRRTWPLLLDWETLDANNHPSQFRIIDSSTELPSQSQTPLLGAIDARRIDLELKHGSTDTWDGLSESFVPWTSSNSGVSWYTITNMRTGWDTTGSTTPANLSTFSLDLEPGEGTLLRVAPATAVEVGRTGYAGMSYNNGNREALIYAPRPPEPCDPNNPPSQDRVMTWEDHGAIEFALVSPAGSTVPEPTPTVTTIYAPSITGPLVGLDSAHNPSIASKPGGPGFPDTIVVVFSGTYIVVPPARKCRFPLKNSNYLDI